MYDVVTSIKDLLKFKTISIDNSVFRLHYKATMFILVLFSLLVTQKQYFGDPIDCIVDRIPQEMMDTYCWIHSTFTIPDYTNAAIGEQVPHPGIANDDGDHEVKYHKYYQWVALTLFFQAMCFYAPHFIWKIWEGGKLKMLVMNLNSPIVEEETKQECKGMLVRYAAVNMLNHNLYFFKFFLCEVLNYINVVLQIYLTDAFLGHEFTTYGIRVIAISEGDPEDRDDPMNEIFPKVTKCTFHKYGASGTVETYDGLCVLPLNVLNEKIYIFLWFWFLALAIVTTVGLIYRFATFFGPVRRILLQAKSRLVPTEDIEFIVQKCSIGDWFLLYQISKNMDRIYYKEFIMELSDRLQGKDAME